MSSVEPLRLLVRGGRFAAAHQRLLQGTPGDAEFDATSFDPRLLEAARVVWQERVGTEYRSTQLMNRLLTELLATGAPSDEWAAVSELIADELKHVALCASVVRRLGDQPLLPPPDEPSVAFERMPASQRALSIGIALLLVNETLSVGYIRDLHARCKQPFIHAVLDATLGDEAEHGQLGVEYVRRALSQLPIAALPQWRAVAEEALGPQLTLAEAVLSELPADKRKLSCWPDEAEVQLGLFSRERQALVFQQTYREHLLPRLRELELT